MSENKQLAIASVAVQTWQNVYDEAQALCVGTIFPELNKPFYVTVKDERLKQGQDWQKEKKKSLESSSEDFAHKNQSNNSSEEMLLMIQQISFMVDDLRLYMDTHPKDMAGLELLKGMIRKRKELLKEFAKKYYPLTMDCMADIYEENPDSMCYCWEKGPIPWEGVCV